MNKLIAIAIIAMIGASAMAADTVGKVTYRTAPLSTATTNTVSFTARSGYVTEPVLFVTKAVGATPNSSTITVNPALSGAPDYTAVGATVVSNTTSAVVLNDYSSSSSPKVILLGGDVLTVTGTAAVWTNTDHYIVIKETAQ